MRTTKTTCKSKRKKKKRELGTWPKEKQKCVSGSHHQQNKIQPFSHQCVCGGWIQVFMGEGKHLNSKVTDIGLETAKRFQSCLTNIK